MNTITQWMMIIQWIILGLFIGIPTLSLAVMAIYRWIYRPRLGSVEVVQIDDKYAVRVLAYYQGHAKLPSIDHRQAITVSGCDKAKKQWMYVSSGGRVLGDTYNPSKYPDSNVCMWSNLDDASKVAAIVEHNIFTERQQLLDEEAKKTEELVRIAKAKDPKVISRI